LELWVPEGRAEEVIVRVAAVTTRDRVADLVWAGFAESATPTVKLAVPVEVGVPEMMPVLVFRLRPAGRLPETKDHV
jgi:hypothetical protein